MSEAYPPTTEQVRLAYGDAYCPDVDGDHDDGCPADKAFDRWLDQHDREVAAKALREAADAMDADPGFRDPLRLHSDWLRTLSGKSEAKQ